MPEKYKDVLDAAHEILGDFDNWGPVLQTDDNSEYGPESPIERLRAAVNRVEMTDEQYAKYLDSVDPNQHT